MINDLKKRKLYNIQYDIYRKLTIVLAAAYIRLHKDVRLGLPVDE